MSTNVTEQHMSLHEAIRMAEQAHRNQSRKGSNISYIIHPMEVLQILTAMGADIETQIAGVLHDTVEDTDVVLGDIQDKFGKRVAELVSSHTEDKSLSWKERKKHTIREMEMAERSVKMLIFADLLSNIRSMVYDYQIVGEKLWDRFNAAKDKKGASYAALLKTLVELENDSKTKGFYQEALELFKQLFGDVDLAKAEF